MSTESSPNRAPADATTKEDTGGPLVIDGISYIPSSVLLVGIPKLSFKDNRAFGVVDPRGEAPRSYSTGSELGFYYNDTRYLSIWETTFNGEAPIGLSHELRFDGNTLVLSMTNRDIPKIGGSGRIPRDTFLIRRTLSLCHDTLYEIIAIRNFSAESHVLQLEQWMGSRFDDVFEVRGFDRPRRGRMLGAYEEFRDGAQVTTLQYEGLDGKVRRSHIYRYFESEKIRLSPNMAGYFTRVEIPAKGDAFIKTAVSFDKPFNGKLHSKSFQELSVPEVMFLLADKAQESHFAPVRIETDNAIINRSIQKATTDILTLLTVEKDSLLYPYAGIPWYSAPFGRDGVITAYQMLPWYPDLAKGVLDYAFATLGTRFDEFTDEQPGKVFHEMRRGEMANTREVPFIPYYGSVDSTPLALILMHEYISWTMNLDKLREWWPTALRALEWVEKWGDANQDGFLEYAKQSPTGLVNQGWKDSHDSVMHSNGVLASPPISLCEVQGYSYRAKWGMAMLARLLGYNELSEQLRMGALELKARFMERYWNAERQSIYLALDGQSQPCDVLSSNMGHCLWSQILQPEHARLVSRHLMSDAMFNGYGIRTLADTEVSYNPLSYHNGSVWPHDNSLIMEGFRYYGHTEELERLSSALIGVLESSSDFRLPELFCGFRKRGDEPPVPYEVACKPQAWAAGSVFLMLKAMVGLAMDPDQHHLIIRSPLLSHKMTNLEIHGLKGRDWEMDLYFKRSAHGTGVTVSRRHGKVRVLTVK